MCTGELNVRPLCTGGMSGYTNQPSLQGEYEAATKHFLLIGFLAMLVGSVVFGYFAMKKKEGKMQVISCPAQALSVASHDTAAYVYVWWGVLLCNSRGSGCFMVYSKLGWEPGSLSV